MKKAWLMIALSSMSVLAACNASTTTGDSDSSSSAAMMDDEVSSIESSVPYLDEDDMDSDDDDGVEIDVSSSAGTTSSAADAATSSPSAAARVIEVSVTDWSFSPNVINAKKGEKVQLKLVGGTGIHSLAIPGLEMNVRVEAGQTVVVDLPTDTVGTFDAMCRIPCGPGHKEMKATVVIA